MAKFTIYNYHFSPVEGASQGDAFADLKTVDEAMARKHELISEFFAPDSLWKFHNGSQRHEHIVVFRTPEIIMLRIDNTRYHEEEKDFKRETRVSHPSLYVIIDNREDGIQSIAVENRPQAFSSPQVVVNLISKTMNRFFNGYGIQMRIEPKWPKDKFWNFVEDSGERGIASIHFLYPYPNMPVISDLVGGMMGFSKEIVGCPQIKFSATEKGERLYLDKDNPTLNKLVDASSGTGSEIRVRRVGEPHPTRIGKNAVVKESLKEKVIKSINDGDVSDDVLAEVLAFMRGIKLTYEHES